MESKKVAILTGVSSGIGFYLSIYLSKEAIVYGILRNKQKFLQNLKKNNLSLPENLNIIQMDVREYPKAKQLIKKIYKKHGRVDFLVNNAGYGVYGAFEEIPSEEFRNQFETNFFAPLEWIRLVLPIMRKQRNGKILNITSILGLLTIPTSAAYASSKFSLVAVSEVLNYELAPFSIEVCSVEPGLVKTDFKANMVIPEELDNKNSSYYFLNQIIKKNLFSYPRWFARAETAALQIYKLLYKKSLPVHYKIGFDAKFYWFLKSILPENLLNFLIKKYIYRVYKKYES
ncbi:MAG: SDR family oxidoreductase [Leptonema sp. (in: bacteria)]